jgi:hypothetical protein
VSWDFDGEREINLKLERGQSFGLSKDQYGALAHVAMAAKRVGVEPAEIRILPGGEPGCDVILYGRNYAFTVRMEPLKERSGLYGLPLDSPRAGAGEELYVHRFADSDYVGDILAIILRREGVDVMTFREYYGEDPDFYGGAFFSNSP